MKHRYRIYRKETGFYYSFDKETGKRESLETKDRHEALELVQAKNRADREPTLNLHLARTFLAASDSETLSRTWQTVFDEIVKTKQSETKARWLRASADRAFEKIKTVTLFETRAEHFLRVLERGSVSTNVYLRRLHNFALGMNWLLAPVLPRKQWPAVRYEEKRAITFDEHRRIVEAENNAERRAFFELAWHLGASQSDLANLHAESVDWPDRVIVFNRMKIRFRNQPPVRITFDDEVAELLKSLPQQGPLFPRLCTMHEKHRAKEFKRLCVRLGIEGISLHSYRYAWAERAKESGYPERFAMEALGHNSKAVHRAYAKKALVTVPSLEEWKKRVVQMPKAAAIV